MIDNQLNEEPQQSAEPTAGRFGYRSRRTPELIRKNRRVGFIVALVAVVLVVGTILYVMFYGGINSDMRRPLHSSLIVIASRTT